MADVSARSTAMLVIRVWRENGLFRATVSSSPDVVTSKLAEHDSAAAPDEVLAIVGRWLHAI